MAGWHSQNGKKPINPRMGHDDFRAQQKICGGLENISAQHISFRAQ
jgi:hypothetical protein